MSLLIELLPRYGSALVVGGGAVAARKVRSLIEGEFRVTVVAPEVCAEIAEIARIGEVRCERRPFDPADLAGHGLAFACTDSREVNAMVGEAARAAGILVVVADAQDESTFFSPAVHRDGDLAVAVSTSGASPALAREVLERAVVALGKGWAERVDGARAARQRRRTSRAGTEPDE